MGNETVSAGRQAPAGGKTGGEDLQGFPGEEESGCEAPGLAEAGRRFPPPDPEACEHALRELRWGEQYVASQVIGSKGSIDRYLYSLRSAAILLLGETQARPGQGADGTITLIDVDAFIAWIRDTVGDGALADALEDACPACDPYTDRLTALRQLLALRMVQYGAAERADGGEDAGAAPGEDSAPL